MSTKYRLGRATWRNFEESCHREWMIANGIGGFANGSVVDGCTRSQSAYLVASLNPPVERINILSNINETVYVGGETIELESQQFTNSKFTNGYEYLESFEFEYLPEFCYKVYDTVIKKSICLERNKNTVVVKYAVDTGIDSINIKLNPLFSCIEAGNVYDSAQKMNLDMKLQDDVLEVYNNDDKRYTAKLITSKGKIVKRTKELIQENYTYAFDRYNGYEVVDCKYIPCDIDIFVENNTHSEFYVKCTIEELDYRTADDIIKEYIEYCESILAKQDMDDDYLKKLTISADTFIVDRKSTGLKTILAGYPWFMDWGRDTMIALQGLTLCTGRYEDTRAILESFAMYESKGLIPNRFASSEQEELLYNTVDASMWYFYSVYKYLEYTGEQDDYKFIQDKIYPVLKKIINAYKNGTDFSIKMMDDCLITAGGGLDQVTWMDVRVGEWVVTPRHGKPVEINALWYNALMVMDLLSKKFGEDTTEYIDLADKVKESFCKKFWNEELQCLYDVIDENDPKIRPNQIWAVSLPFTMLDRDKEKKIVDTVYRHLYTTYGLRTLSYKDKEFKKFYRGKLSDRDAAYHMGTVWPFPLGGFITAYCKVNDYAEEAVNKAKDMCIACFDTLNDGCINGISEVFDGLNPCAGNGCFNQAWSVGELLRAYKEDVLKYLI